MAADAVAADMAVVDAAVAVDTVDAAAAVATTAMMIEIKSRGFSDVYYTQCLTEFEIARIYYVVVFS